MTQKEAIDRLVSLMFDLGLATGHADTLGETIEALEMELRDIRKPRPAVRLSDEEIALLVTEYSATADRWNDFKFARTIEALVLQKNKLEA